MKNKQTVFFCFSIDPLKMTIITLFNLYIGVYDKMLWTQYVRSNLTYEIDIWYAVPDHM